MDGIMSSTTEMNRIACLKKKRKLQAELLGMPMSKHLCWEYDSSSDSSRESKKMENYMCPRQGKSDPEPVKDTDTIMCTCNGAKNDTGFPKTCSSDKPCTSCVSLSGVSSGINVFSLESRSLIKSNFIKSQTLSLSEQLDCPHHHNGLHPSMDYEEHLLKFRYHDDCSSYSECTIDVIELYGEKELENQLYSNGVPPSNYVLSSGRWSVNQDTPRGAKKLTIDKEFEQFFSMLML